MGSLSSTTIALEGTSLAAGPTDFKSNPSVAYSELCILQVIFELCPQTTIVATHAKESRYPVLVPEAVSTNTPMRS